jgi:exportin-7
MYYSDLLNTAQRDRLCDAVLKLISKCMAFDFIGTTPDESGEDSGTIQVNNLID